MYRFSNRTSQTIKGSSTTATYDDQDRLLTFGGKTFTYNANGEVATQTSGGMTTTFTYDVYGNLKQHSTPSKTVVYKVDAHNRRMSKKVGSTMKNFFIWNDKDQLIGITNGSGTLQSRFVYGSKNHVPDYMIKGSVKYKIITNHLGSPVVVVHSTNGTIAQQLTYDEFGNILSDSSPGFTPFGFAGCLYDTDTKLCRFGARDYDASIGRWLSKDPIRFDGGDSNLYGYVMQDPVNFIDPIGLWAWPSDVYDVATEETKRRYGGNGHNDISDAFRHCLASCMMTQENGFVASWATGSANEVKGDLMNKQPVCENEMDTSNNAFGSHLGQSSGSCSNRCASAASQGLLTTLK